MEIYSTEFQYNSIYIISLEKILQREKEERKQKKENQKNIWY